MIGRAPLSTLIAVSAGVMLWASPRVWCAQPDATAPRSCTEIKGVREFTGRVIARPVQNDQARHARALEHARAACARMIDDTDEILLRVPAGMSEPAYIQQLLDRGDYEYVEPDWRLTSCTTIPSDVGATDQWHLAPLGCPNAWDTTVGSTSVVVAVVDSGIETAHADLSANIVNGVVILNGVTTTQASGGNVQPVNFHGTGVSSIACAAGSNIFGLAGITWTSKLMPVRVTNDPNGTALLSDITAGIRWAADHGAKVINASWSGADNSTFQTAASYAKARGALLVMGSGNEGLLLNSNTQPDILIVAGTDKNNARSVISNYGASVKIAAPAEQIRIDLPGDTQISVTGTSFAAPMAAGAAALVWAVNPALTPAQVMSVLTGTAQDLGAAGRDNEFGAGLLRVDRAVLAAANPTGPPIVAGESVSTLTSTPVTIDVLANDFDPRGQALTLLTPAGSTGGGGTVTITSLNGRAALVYTPAPGFGGTDTISYTVRNTSLQSTAGTVTITVSPASAYRAPDTRTNPQPGLFARYYLTGGSSLPDFTTLTPDQREIVTSINWPWSLGALGPRTNTTNVGAVFQGYFYAPQTAAYSFFTQSDDGSKLLIGSTSVVNNDGLHLMQERSGLIRLSAGWHAVRVEFFSPGNGQGLVVLVEGGGLSKQPVPAANWSWDASPADIATRGGTPGADGVLTSDDVIMFFQAFFADGLVADIATSDGAPGHDGVLTAADVVLFFQSFFAGTPQ